MPRSLQGPTETRLQDQDARIGILETSFRDMKAQADERHEAYQAARREDSQLHRETTTELRQQISSLSSDFASQLRSSVDSLQGAQQQQLQQVMLNFEELKSLISCRDREPSKKPRTETQT